MAYLENVPDDKAFILGNQRILNLEELLAAIKEMSVEDYGHYAGSEHNYFADWIYFCLGYNTLAENLRNSVSKEESVVLIENAIAGQRKNSALIKRTRTKTAGWFTRPHPDKPHPESHFEILDNFDEPLKDETGQFALQNDQGMSHKEQESIEEVELMMKKISRNEKEIRDILWKHFAWDLAKEFMYGMAVGIIIGFILSKILLR